jgi:molybdate transport system ATP-binding protein
MGSLQVQLENSTPMRLAAQFDCAAGELIALVGPSGSGKTSLLRAVAGVLRAPAMTGRVQVGQDIWFDSQQGVQLSPQQRCVGLVFQHYALFPHMSALENVAISTCESGRTQEMEEKLRQIFSRLGLGGLEHRKPSELSGGQQQRVALARALMRVAMAHADGAPRRSGVLLLDEPFSAIDAPTRQTLYRELASLRRDVSTPMVLVTHDLSEARRLADRVVIVDAGQTLQSGTPAHVFASPRNARVAELIGIQNHFKGYFHKAQPGWGVLRWGSDNAPDQAPLELKVVDKNKLAHGVAVSWVLAGEAVDVLPDSDQVEGENIVRCLLHEVLALGETSLCTMLPQKPASVTLTLSLSTALLRGMGAQQGGFLRLRIAPQGVHIMPVRGNAAPPDGGSTTA